MKIMKVTAVTRYFMLLLLS